MGKKREVSPAGNQRGEELLPETGTQKNSAPGVETALGAFAPEPVW